MRQMKRDCYWCSMFGDACKVLVEPVCRYKKCSFYETKADFTARKAAFRKKLLETRGKKPQKTNIRIASGVLK